MDEIDAVLDGLSEARRRETLQVLQEHAAPMSLETLAVYLAASEEEVPLRDVSEEQIRTRHINLYHVQIPKLADSGLVALNRSDETVTTTDHPAFSDQRVQTILTTEGPDWDTVLTAISHPRRRAIISVLIDYGTGLTVGNLTRYVREWEADHDDFSSPPHERDPIRRSILTTHLPVLVSSGLVEYDSQVALVSYRGHPELDEGWLTEGDCVAASGDTGTDPSHRCGLDWLEACSDSE